MYALRTRLALGTAVGTSIVLLAGGVLLYLFARASLLTQFDRSLADKARLLASTVEAEFGQVEVEFGELDMREFEDTSGPGYLQLWYADGSVAFRSPSLAGGELQPLTGPAGSPLRRWVTLPGGQSGRAVGIAFRPGGGDEIVPDETGSGWTTNAAAEEVALVVAESTAAVDRTLGRLKALLLLIGPLTVIVSVGVLYCVIHRGLRPLTQVAEEISKLGGTDLSARIESRNAPTEIRPVVQRLNDLLGRLEDAFRRERSFSADVAHELRTPVAGVRSIAEVALSMDRTDEEYKEALRDALDVTTQMQDMVEKLLSLSRLEARQVDITPEQLFPNDLVRACWEPFAGAAAARRLQIQWALGPRTPVTTDRRLLELAIRNVIENAVSYADEGGTLRVETTAGQDSVDIRVSNTGSTLSQDDAGHVFERFWRADAARAAAGVRSGLGLSLVHRIMAVLGASARAESRVGGCFVIALAVPPAWCARGVQA